MKRREVAKYVSGGAPATLGEPGHSHTGLARGIDSERLIERWKEGRSPQTLRVRVGPTASGHDLLMNGAAGGRFFGGAAAATLVVEEIYV